MNIKKIEQYGIHHVFNTNVENTHNFVDEHGFIHKNCLVDPGYMGEIFINMINVGKEQQKLQPGEKIVQFVVQKVIQNKLTLVEQNELYEKESERKEGGFGSTGDK